MPAMLGPDRRTRHVNDLLSTLAALGTVLAASVLAVFDALPVLQDALIGAGLRDRRDCSSAKLVLWGTQVPECSRLRCGGFRPTKLTPAAPSMEGAPSSPSHWTWAARFA